MIDAYFYIDAAYQDRREQESRHQHYRDETITARRVRLTDGKDTRDFVELKQWRYVRGQGMVGRMFWEEDMENDFDQSRAMKVTLDRPLWDGEPGNSDCWDCLGEVIERAGWDEDDDTGPSIDF